MGGVSNHPQQEDFSAWMRGQERRTLTQERRSSRFELERSLGPAAGKFAKQVFDWNNENTWFTGVYWSDVGSFNSPDGDRQWIVESYSVAGLGGYQSAVSLDYDRLHYTRNYFFAANEIATFGDWFGDTVWADAVLLNSFAPIGAPYSTPGYRIKNEKVELRGVATLPAGPAYGLVIFNLPVKFRPTEASVHAVDSGVGHARVDVTSAGDVTCLTVTSALSYISLDNLVIPIT